MNQAKVTGTGEKSLSTELEDRGGGRKGEDEGGEGRGRTDRGEAVA